MADSEPAANPPKDSDAVKPFGADEELPWRGLVAFLLMSTIGAMGPDLAPSPYWPGLDHYIPRYVVLAVAIGFAVSAIRSKGRLDKLIGIAVLAVGAWLVVHIVEGCVRIIGW